MYPEIGIPFISAAPNVPKPNLFFIAKTFLLESLAVMENWV